MMKSFSFIYKRFLFTQCHVKNLSIQITFKFTHVVVLLVMKKCYKSVGLRVKVYLIKDIIFSLWFRMRGKCKKFMLDFLDFEKLWVPMENKLLQLSMH